MCFTQHKPRLLYSKCCSFAFFGKMIADDCRFRPHGPLPLTISTSYVSNERRSVARETCSCGTVSKMPSTSTRLGTPRRSRRGSGVMLSIVWIRSQRMKRRDKRPCSSYRRGKQLLSNIWLISIINARKQAFRKLGKETHPRSFSIVLFYYSTIPPSLTLKSHRQGFMRLLMPIIVLAKYKFLQKKR